MSDGRLQEAADLILDAYRSVDDVRVPELAQVRLRLAVAHDAITQAQGLLAGQPA